MRNKISDLNNYLFAQLERLDDESMDKDHLESEIERSKAISLVAAQIIHTGALALKAQEYICDAKVNALPEFLG